MAWFQIAWYEEEEDNNTPADEDALGQMLTMTMMLLARVEESNMNA